MYARVHLKDLQITDFLKCIIVHLNAYIVSYSYALPWHHAQFMYINSASTCNLTLIHLRNTYPKQKPHCVITASAHILFTKYTQFSAVFSQNNMQESWLSLQYIRVCLSAWQLIITTAFSTLLQVRIVQQILSGFFEYFFCQLQPEFAIVYYNGSVLTEQLK